MNAAAEKRARDGINRRGHILSFRRGNARADVKAISCGYAPDRLVPGITVGTRHLVVSVLDLQAAGFPVPLRKGDRVYFGAALDVPTTIGSVDPDHREYQGCLDISVTGA
jgi:hypothetical protein